MAVSSEGGRSKKAWRAAWIWFILVWTSLACSCVHHLIKMASETRTSMFNPTDKRSIKMEPAGPEAMEEFRARLTEDEKVCLQALKDLDPEVCAPWNDAFLMRFVWARKLDATRALELLKNHLKWREEWDIDHLDMAAVDLYFRQGSTLWAPGNYTKQGHSVSYLLLNKFDKDAFAGIGMKGILHASYYALDLSLDHDMQTGRKGGVIVEDFSGASFMDLMSMMKGGDFDMKKMMDSVQNHLPSRMGGIIILNAPWYIRALTTFAKPFLKPKLRKKIHICSISELKEYFSPEQLPTIYGGQFNLEPTWVDELLAKRPHLSEGTYLDPSEWSEELVAQTTGSGPVRSVSEVVAESKGKNKKDKKKKSVETTSSAPS